MQILCVSDFAEDVNAGAAGSILASGGALRARGHTVEYLWHDSRRFRLVHPTLYRLFELPRRQYAQVARRLSERFYDVVIVSQPYAYLIYEELPARHSGTLFVNRTHGWETRLYEASKRLGWRRRGALGRFVVPVTQMLAARACARTARACQSMIVPARRCADFVAARHAVSREKIHVVPYGGGENARRRRAARGGDAPLRLLFVGTYLPRKGSAVLERILPGLALKHRDFQVTFVINGDAHAEVERRLSPSLGKRLTVHSWMDRDALSAIYDSHDVLLFPSLFEGFGKTFLEAMAHGLCVVGFNEGALGDIARSGCDALYCEPGDEASFSALMERCLQEPALAASIGERAVVRAGEFTWDRNARATEEMCAALLASRP